MKKTLLLLTILACGAAMAHIAAQTTANASIESEYPTEFGKNVRICVNPADGATVIYYRDTVLDTNCFIYHKHGASPDNKFVWPPIPEGTGFATCTVEDMKIIGDILYFCGTADYPDGGTRKQRGYLGWVRTSQLMNSYGGVTFKYYARFEDSSVPPKKNVGLSHLDGVFNKTDNDTVKIGLIGKYEYTAADTSSCLLLVKKSSSGWDYQLHYLTDPKETFTDIVFIEEKWLVVPSRFEYNYMDHYRFGIRRESVSTAFSMPTSLPQFQTVNKFNTHNLSSLSSTSPYPTWHRDDVEIHIIDDPTCSAYAIVAYECMDTAKQCENSQQTALFKLDINSSPISIYASQLVHGYFRSPRTFVEIKNVLDSTAMVLLHRGLGDNGELASTLLFPTWTHYGQIDGLLADYRNNTSLDVLAKRYIRLGGTSLIDNNNILHYHLDRQHINSSCYSTRPTFFSEELSGDYTLESPLVRPKCNKSSFSWRSYTMSHTTITNNSSCETYYPLE